MITIAFAGDVNLAWGVSARAQRHGPEYPWGDTLPLLRQADLRIVNLECPISERGQPFRPKRFRMKAAPVAVEVLKAANIDCVALANNHILDFGREALVDTLAALDRAGIQRAGAGLDLREAIKPAELEVAGRRVAVISLTDTIPMWAATPQGAGVNFLPLWAFPQIGQLWSWRFALFAAAEPLIALRVRLRWSRICAALQQQMSHPAFADAHIRVLSCHMGPNWRTAPSDYYRRFARHAVDSGVHVYHGHSAHLPQGVAIREGKTVLYDTGDFVDNYGQLHGHRNDLSFLYLLDIDERTGASRRLTMVPVQIAKSQVNLATGTTAADLCAGMQAMCGRLGTPATVHDGRVQVDIGETGA